jgi:hypothetical protein
MKRPIKKDYYSQNALSAAINANEGSEKYVIFDSKQYAKDAEKYIEHITKVMRLTAGNLRDVAVGLGQAHKDYSTIHELADRLYNATMTK